MVNGVSMVELYGQWCFTGSDLRKLGSLIL